MTHTRFQYVSVLAVVFTITSQALAAEVIVDNTSSGFSISGGTWATATAISGYYGTNYRERSCGSSQRYAYWQPTIPTTGFYEVSIWYPADSTRTTLAALTVTYNGGSQAFTINQQQNGGQWVVLGTFNFLAGSSTNGRVTLSSQSSETTKYVAADAVRFVETANYNLTMAAFPSGGGTTTPAVGGPYTKTQNEVVSISASPSSGYTFSHWGVSTGSPAANPTSTSTTVTMDTAKTVTAYFKKPEYRAFWVDAWGTDFHNQAKVDELLGVVGDPNSKGTIRDVNCNMIIIQARRRADVCYPSGVGEPYFSGLTPADFNALQAVINAAHDTTGGKQYIEVHAWLVAFSTDGGTVFTQHSDPANPDNYWPTLTDAGALSSNKGFDPGHPKALEYTVNVCMDLVRNFDIDGIHYDYIRYTANNEGYNPTSIARYNARYGLSGQPASTSEQFKQWRRDQVTAVVRQVYARIQAEKPSVRQSGSFVTWNPSPTASTRAAFQATRPYYDVYSDWDSWIQEGLVDMAVPMTYYDYAALPTDFVKWMNFEKDRKGNRHMIVGPGTYHNNLDNAILELKMTRDPSPAGNYAEGFSAYSYRSPYYITWSPLVYGTWSVFAPRLVTEVTPTPQASIPVMPWKVAPTLGHIMGTVTIAPGNTWADGATVSITGPANRTMTCDGTGFYAFIDLPTGNYTITASLAGYPDATASANVQIGVVTGNMYERNMVLGGQSCNTPKMDANGDLHVDATDFDAFSACYNGPTNKVSGDCLCLDANGDEYVDATDFDAFSSCYNGPANPPGCP